ncbi:MAG: NAD-dependent epimerase/dehydratase family protein, partial [Chitinophagaceae bacterium]|nr:NAD-dependent epimerase/dehydratase family protein [Chitinophagaceae bacterium]
MNFSYSHYNWHNDESLKNKSFLITGGAGFIGSHVAEYLLEHGAGKVRILDNFSLGNISNLKAFADNPSLEIMKADITDQNDCKVALFDIDYVCHLAAIGSVPRSIIDPENTHQANVTGFLQILNAAKNAGVTGMVYASSSAVYGDSPVIPRKEEIIGSPLSPYALSKYMNEEYAALYSNVYGFQTTGLRFFNVFGARQNPEGAYAAVIPRFFKAALNNQSPEIYGDGTVGRDFTHVANVVQVCVKAMMQKIT